MAGLGSDHASLNFRAPIHCLGQDRLHSHGVAAQDKGVGLARSTHSRNVHEETEADSGSPVPEGAAGAGPDQVILNLRSLSTCCM